MALPFIEIDVAAGAGRDGSLVPVPGDKFLFVYFAEADEVRVVELVGIRTQVIEGFAVGDVFLTDVSSDRCVVFRWGSLLSPEFFGEPGPVLFLALFIKGEQILIAVSLFAG